MSEVDLAKYRPMIEASLPFTDDGWTVDKVLEECASGGAKFWPGKRSFLTTEETRELSMWMMGGNLKELALMERAIAEQAKAAGITRITAEVVRPELYKALTKIGYREARIMVKDL